MKKIFFAIFKVLFIFLCILGFMGFLSICVVGYEITSCIVDNSKNEFKEVNGFTLYVYGNGEADIIELSEAAKSSNIYEIPEKIGEYKIVRLGNRRGFFGNKIYDFGKIKYLKIPSYIEEVSFSVSESTVVHLEKKPSEYKGYFSAVYLIAPFDETRPDFIYLDNNSMYSNCYFEDVEINGVQGVSLKLFFGNSLNFEVPSEFNNKPVIQISSFAFRYSNVNNVYVSDTVMEIEQYAFENCDNLNTIKLSTSMKEIVKYSFYDCPNLDKVEIPFNIKYIDEKAFYNCPLLDGKIEYGEINQN